MRTLLLCLFVTVIFTTAHAKTYVDPVQRFEILNSPIEVGPGRFWLRPLPMNAGDSIEIEVTLANKMFKDISVLICSEPEFDRFKNSQPYRCWGEQKAIAPIGIKFTAQAPGTYYVVLDNTYAAFIKKKVQVRLTATAAAAPEAIQALEKMVNGFEELVHQRFVTPEFDLKLAPCNTENAFSEYKGGHITFCSELFVKLARDRMTGAITGVYFHELGHTLLNLWGLPGWNNEETVDEFAIVMLYYEGHQELAMDFIKWFSENDPRMEIQAALQTGSKHPLSIQRIRNVEAILRNPGPVIRRWNNLLYPHMTEANLRRIVENPQQYEDAALAAKELAGRAAMGTAPALSTTPLPANGGWGNYTPR